MALPIWAPALRRALRLANARRGDRTARQPNTRWHLRRAEAAVRYATASLAIAAGANRDDVLIALLVDCVQTVELAKSDQPVATARPVRAGAGNG